MIEGFTAVAYAVASEVLLSMFLCLFATMIVIIATLQDKKLSYC